MFVKMFTQIFDSSIADDYQVRHLFEDLCKLADVDGVVDMTPEAISARTRIPLELVNTALTKLSSPDPRSRSPQEEGRRIILIDSHRNWGWRIVNYEHYRELRDDDARRSYFRDYMREYRAKKRSEAVINSKQMLNDVNPRKPQLTQAEAEAEAEADQVHTRTVLPKHIGLVEASPEGARAIEKSKERMVPLPPLPDKRVVKDKSEVKQAVKSCLCVMYKRPEDEPWQYAEECLLIEILKRPDPLRDITMLREFRSRMKSKRYFPQSIGRLLQDWATTLDRARVAEKNPSLCSD